MDNENKKTIVSDVDDINENNNELKENKEILLDDFAESGSDNEKEIKIGEGLDGAPQNISAGSARDSVVIPKSKAVLVKKLLSNIKENSDKLSNILSDFITDEDEVGLGQAGDEAFKTGEGDAGEGKIVEGVFDGENMIGPDGKQYSVPANYASKSKMVEGDILKLTITSRGIFVYKQISPIERSRVIGELEKNGDGNFYVKNDGRKWRVLPASVTYFKGEPGDEAVILVPKSGESKWAAVENIVRNQLSS
ncbi:MAG: hypothetical protein GWO79_01070 [Actinobacteria bacterium]|nr:hypothetical protein [Actinomycetota bacterium]